MKLILLFIISIITTINLNAYSYAATGKEPSIDAKEAILNAINKDDFYLAKKVLEESKEHYVYLTNTFNNKLYSSLEKSILDKDKKEVNHWLNISLATEIQRRVEGGLENIKVFNIAKVMLAKADKFYKILSPFLDKKQDKELSSALKECIESIGNPGLFGVGAKPYNIEKYKLNQEIAVKILKSI